MRWLLDADPAIRWQVLRDLTDASIDEIERERARIATTGWGAELLARQSEQGQWGGGTYHPYWTSTTYTLLELRLLGLDPASDEARRAVRRVREHERLAWSEEDDAPFFHGEIETCINGMVLALGAYFGVPDEGGILERLLAEQLPDGGWNCWAGEAWPDDETDRSSFHTTITVLEALLEHEHARGAEAEVTAAAERGREYLLERRMFRRRSTGEVVDPAFTRFAFPPRWHYDVLRGLEHLWAAGVQPDERVEEAIAMVHDRQRPDGRWDLDASHDGEVHVAFDEGEGRPSRWNTLRALRVIGWASDAAPGVVSTTAAPTPT